MARLRSGPCSAPLTSTATWTLTAIAICACLAAVVSSYLSKGEKRSVLRDSSADNGRRRQDSLRRARSGSPIVFRPGSQALPPAMPQKLSGRRAPQRSDSTVTFQRRGGFRECVIIVGRRLGQLK